jgi:hypothetical protein
MRDQIDKLLESYADIYSVPDSNRILELQTKFGDLEFDGIHIGAPSQVDPAITGIPTLTLESTGMHRGWEVDERLNQAIVCVDLIRSDIRVLPLYKPPTKRLKPTPKGPKPADLSTTARSYGARLRIIGETGDVEPGIYSVSVIEWDRVSNIRTVVKKPKPGALLLPTPVLQWPWELWKAQATDFQAQASSHKLDGDAGLAVEAVGSGDQTNLLGSFATKARPIHIIVTDPGSGVVKSDIRAGVPVDLLQFTLDKTAPERLRILVPIKAAAALKPGDVLKGWFSYPLPKLQRKEETLVYVFVDGMRSGPIRIPALKP